MIYPLRQKHPVGLDFYAVVIDQWEMNTFDILFLCLLSSLYNW